MINVNLNYKELYPQVDVYTGLLPDADKLYNIMKDSEANANGQFLLKKWDRWATFGTYSVSKLGVEDSNQKEFIEEKYLSDRVHEASKIAVNDYVKRHEIQLPDQSGLTESSFCKYDADIDELNNNHTMQYHTDYIISEKDMPGSKFFLTCTTYINDDYDGGDICFYIDGKFINHKPKAGDIVVFPSNEPYYHGVKTITKGNKFFVRNFVIYTFEGTPEWLENQRRYGAHKWAKMEIERVESENANHMRYVSGDTILTYEEFLKRK